MLIAALDLPAGARVDRRVPKKLLLEHGAPTAADKRAIQDGIEELQWVAALKPTTIGVPSFSDDDAGISGDRGRRRSRSGLERKPRRLIELIHRAIPYPVLLVTSDETGHRALGRAQTPCPERCGQGSDRARRFRCGDQGRPVEPARAGVPASLALARQSRGDLFTLYEGMLARIEALNAARLNGAFAAADDPGSIKRRREALEAHFKLTCEITGLRAKATREKQMNRRVVLNLEIQRLEADIAMHKKNL